MPMQYQFEFFDDSVERRLWDLKSKDNKNFDKLVQMIKNIEVGGRTKYLEMYKSRDIGSLRNTDGILELRKPKSSRSGVYRVYFAKSKSRRKKNTFIILHSEYKDDHNADSDLGPAIRNLRKLREEERDERAH